MAFSGSEAPASKPAARQAPPTLAQLHRGQSPQGNVFQGRSSWNEKSKGCRQRHKDLKSKLAEQCIKPWREFVG